MKFNIVGRLRMVAAKSSGHKLFERIMQKWLHLRPKNEAPMNS